ncbi:hypothetical protein OG738_11665 [Amycolatopsis sp. NBC_01488]|uniref:hypothetical protein n=1 Tax=Amycolatopsis sp. NBC_01488 TaxID=2903563 RepID=UPI002E2A4CE2|nr:hypothetical protein [Amycolatopsis sp. NBC_01488]
MSVRDKPDLAEEILRTVKAAQSRLAAAVRAGVTDPVGPEVLNELVSRLEQAFPAPAPEGFAAPPAPLRNDGDRFVPEEVRQPPPEPPRAPRPSADDGRDDDYFSDGDYLR